MKGVRPERDLTEMPLAVPALPEEQSRLPWLVGHMFYCTILAGNALRPIADQRCRHAMNGLLRAGRVVCPHREAAEKARAAARAAAALEGGWRGLACWFCIVDSCLCTVLVQAVLIPSFYAGGYRWHVFSVAQTPPSTRAWDSRAFAL
jgi:hypothetical protein